LRPAGDRLRSRHQGLQHGMNTCLKTSSHIGVRKVSVKLAEDTFFIDDDSVGAFHFPGEIIDLESLTALLFQSRGNGAQNFMGELMRNNYNQDILRNIFQKE